MVHAEVVCGLYIFSSRKTCTRPTRWSIGEEKSPRAWRRGGMRPIHFLITKNVYDTNSSPSAWRLFFPYTPPYTDGKIGERNWNYPFSPGTFLYVYLSGTDSQYCRLLGSSV